MKRAEITEKIEFYLRELCERVPGGHRHVGSPGNRVATDFFSGAIAAFGFKIDCPEFECIDWTHGDVQLWAGTGRFEAFVSPYSLSFSGNAPLVAASTLQELKRLNLSGKILLLRGELTKEQVMPKNFPFYNPEAHQQLVALLEEKSPLAIIAATGKNPELAGGWYPFPLFEDGDFDIPSVFMKDVDGDRLVSYAGGEIWLRFDSQRIPSTGCNVIARKGTGPDRVVFCAHIDSKNTTPGALDNATGIAILLALAQLLADYSGNLTVEIVAINGEDYYAASGEIQYIQLNEGNFDNILLAFNMDLAGYFDSRSIYTLFGCPEPMAVQLNQILGEWYGLGKGPQWYQSDHSIFIQQGRPAVAITSENFMALSTDITHTEKDTVELVDCNKLAEIASALRDVVQELAASR